ncbi:molybdenum cofactor guanylyltransferase [Arthrobacter zhaoguopingii]|uniref:molybdenum cofactor guanylyltransferase n=1 Tax=Arthrobacter zhaoguopingii TaxID=2681491 RepID=UPI001FE2F71B|nr:NTP transferase domain-containing protein [Arthrobacter zhaoguopingii]
MSGTVPPAFDAVILAGGRSNRLGGTPKASLRIAGATLLELTVRAVAGAGRITVVGPEPAAGVRPAPGAPPVRFMREDPPFGGPAAALAAALAQPEPAGSTAPWLMVLACDMPRSGQLVPALLAAAADAGTSVMASDGGRDQPLAALYRRSDLEGAVAAAVQAGGVENLSMKALLARVSVRPVPVPPGTTLDVDTWADARALGVDDG